MLSLALMTDLYELTMAYGYWKEKIEDNEAVFHLFFRRQPFNGSYAIAAGLESIIDFLKNFHFSDEDVDYLRSLKIFSSDFLLYLKDLRFSCDIDAMPEGEVVFPYEPLIRVAGPLIQCQLLESILLTLINFPTLIATKASRICRAAGGDPVVEFGLRRAQGKDGALTASRASFIGGCSATSHTLAGKLFNIPVVGTQAHSWVMAFDQEEEAFRAYAAAQPDNCFFLIDTYDSIQGAKRAIAVGKELREQGKTFLGVRLDSGDITYLSVKIRKLLDEAGFKDAKIMASNELDEILIADLKQQGAQVSVWGVGTRLVTGHPQGALDGVYKLSALRKKGEERWKYRLKLSESMSKISDPGILQVRRFQTKEGIYCADAIYDIHTDISKGCNLLDPLDRTRKRSIDSSIQGEDLLKPIFRKGTLVYNSPSLQEMQSFCRANLARFDRSILRFYNPHIYPVGMENSLYDIKLQLIEQVRKL